MTSLIEKQVISCLQSVLKDIIEVDLDYPERNREVCVFSVNDITHERHAYNCFAITISVDLRDASAESYVATLVNDHSILITYPCMPYGMLKDSTDRNERLMTQNLHCPKLQLAQDVVINQIQDSAPRQMKRLLLQFPEHVVLANIFAPDTSVVPVDMQTDAFMTVVRDVNVPLVHCYLVWRIANLETHRRAAVAPPAPSVVDVLAAQLQSMFTK